MAPFRVQPSPLGSGLVVTQPCAAGVALCALRWGPASEGPARWTLQLDDGVHAEPLPEPLRYVNHHCDPNVAFDIGAGVLRALRRVEAGDELGAFYPATELELAEPFSCTCGVARCIGFVAGAAHLPAAVLAEHALSPFIASVVRGRAGVAAPAPQSASG